MAMPPRAGLDREKVLAAAADLIAAGGPEALTVANLAQRLQVRPPSLYNHISSLDQLQTDLAVRALRQLTAAIGEAAMGHAGADALTAVAGAYRRFARENPGLYALTQRTRPGDAGFAAASSELVGVVVAVLRGYRLSGDIAIHATRCLRSAIHGFVSLEITGGFGMPLDLDESFARLITLLDRGLRS